MPSGYGYGGEGGKKKRRRRSRSSSSSSSSSDDRRKENRKAKRKGKKPKKGTKEDVVDLDGEKLEKPVVQEVPVPAQDPSKKGAWREEMESKKADAGGDGDDGSEDSEDAEARILEASRKRREDLMSKWVQRGEDMPGGSLEMPDTKISIEGQGSESDGEVDKFFQAQKKLMGDAPEDKAKVDEQKALNKFILAQKAEHDKGDMFDEDEAEQAALNEAVNTAAAIGQTGASGDDWNDVEGYYRAQIGEIMNERYTVTEVDCGKGVFSTVIKAKDMKTGELVAIKVMRCNDMMRKAAEKEIEILERLNKADKKNVKNVIRLLGVFMYRDHLCLVFECMWDNLRVALKKYTKNNGMSLKAVRAYTKQLLIALRHIHKMEIIHADLKPDNILISGGQNVVKICDLGSAMELREVEITPYLVSRFYRAPEIVLGAKYGMPSDTFSMGCTMFELFTGKVLFPGKSNNDMLRLYMEVKGKLPHKFIKTGTVWKTHFDENFDFKYVDKHKATKKMMTRIITDCSQKRTILDGCLHRVGEKQKSSKPEDMLYVKKAKQFADLIEKMTTLDPERRPSCEELLEHPFLTDGGLGPAPPGRGAPPGARREPAAA